jgi:hypothetical protein
MPAGIGDPFGAGELLVSHLAGAVEPALELGDALGVDVEGDDREMPREIDCKREADIAKPDHANADIGSLRQTHRDADGLEGEDCAAE